MKKIFSKRIMNKVVAILTISSILMLFCIPVISNAAGSSVVVTLNKTSVTMDSGKTTTISATVSPDATSDKTVTWSSSDPSIATVSSSGVVTAITKGKVTIYATSNLDSKRSGKCKILVKVPVQAVYLNTSQIETTVNSPDTQLTAIVSPTDANFKAKNVTWLSSDSSVATVSSKGLVSIKGVGTASITATADNGVKGTCTVTATTLTLTDLMGSVVACPTVSVPSPSGLGGKTLKVTLDQTKLTVYKGSTQKLTASIAPPDLSNLDVVWVSSDTGIATVTTGGVITGLACGAVTVTAYSKYDSAKSAKCSVKVTVPTTEIQMNTHKIKTVPGSPGIKLAAKIYPTDAKQKLSWESNNSTVAMVSGSKVSIMGVGIATITATSADGEKAECAVTVGEGEPVCAPGVEDEIITDDTRFSNNNIRFAITPGSTKTTGSTLTIPSLLKKVDILFAFDITGSMSATVASAKANAQNIVNDLKALGVDVQVGVVAFQDYPVSPYGASTDSPYVLKCPITSNQSIVNSSISSLTVSGGSDEPESYTRVMYESYSDTNIGWRTATNKIVMIFGDAIPHDNNIYEGISGCSYTYPASVDSGRDGVAGTADDLDFQTVASAMATQRIKMLYCAPSLNVAYDAAWNHVCTITGGKSMVYSTSNFRTNILDTIKTAINSATVSGLRLVNKSSLPFTSTISPTGYTGVAANVPFSVTITIPAGYSEGTYPLRLWAEDTVGNNYGELIINIIVSN